MKVGIVTFSIDPQDGGSATLIDAILKGVDKGGCDYDFVYVYSNPSIKRVKFDRDGKEYINPSAYKRRHLFRLWGGQLSMLGANIKNFFMLCPMMHTAVSAFDMIAKDEGIDIYWFLAPVEEILATPYIYTVWDLGHRILPILPELSGSMNNWNNREQIYREMIYRSAYILTGNEAGKKEILQNYPITPDKVRILPFPVSEFCFGSEEKPDIEIPKEYYFYPAQFWPHKNHVHILQAIKDLKEEHNKNIIVIFTGSDKYNKDYVEEKIDEYGLRDNVIICGFVRDTELKYLYSHAKAMIFASLVGPNNMPPIEATVLDCPVIISDIEGHREQMGDSAYYFDPLSYKSLADAIIKVENGQFPTKESVEAAAELKRSLLDYDYASAVFGILSEFKSIRELWR